MLTRSSSLSDAMPASGLCSAVNEHLDTAPMMGIGFIGALGRESDADVSSNGHALQGTVQLGATTCRPAADAATAMVLLRERVELVADRLARQVSVMQQAKMEAFGYVEDLDALDASSFQETVHGRLGLVEHQLDRLENVVVTFGTTH